MLFRYAACPQDTRPGEQSCLASAAPDVRAPCARNTLILTKYVPPKSNASVLDPEYDDDVLHYGQKVRHRERGAGGRAGVGAQWQLLVALSSLMPVLITVTPPLLQVRRCNRQCVHKTAWEPLLAWPT